MKGVFLLFGVITAIIVAFFLVGIILEVFTFGEMQDVAVKTALILFVLAGVSASIGLLISRKK